MKNSRVRGTIRLLVLCARPETGAEARSEVGRLLAAGPDWEDLLAKADGEGLVPLLYWNLRSRGAAVPPDVMERLKIHYLRSLARNAQTAKDLEPFLRAVTAAGLKIVLTKGLRLASTIYPDPALRPFWDVDFFARPADWPAIRNILVAQGFEETAEAGTGPEAGDAAWAYSPYFRRNGLIVEFHFSLLGLHSPAGPARLEDMTAPPLAVRGTEVPILSPEHELCYLCLHAQQHSYQKLIWLADIAGLASRPGLDRDKIAGVCASLGIRASVHHGLRLAESLWPGSVPPDLAAGLRPRLLQRAALRFFWPEAAVAGRDALLAWPYDMPSLFSLWERKSPGAAVRVLSGLLFPPRRWLAQASGVPENSPRICLQYARRILRPLGLAARRLVNAR